MPNENTTRIGGSFAPALDAKGLAAYRKLAADAPPQVAEGMRVLADMLEFYRKGPEGSRSTRSTPHPSGRGTIVTLPDDEVKRIWDAVPWDDDLDMYAKVFDRIDPVAQKELRNAAFHLLWFGRELFLDRVPLTADKLDADLIAAPPESPEPTES